jgi:hypothetical protein
MIALGVITALVIEGVLGRFNFLVMGNGLMQDMIGPVQRAPPQPVQQLSLLFWKFLVMAVEHGFGYSSGIRESPLPFLSPGPSLQATLFDRLPISSPPASLLPLPSIT